MLDMNIFKGNNLFVVVIMLAFSISLKSQSSGNVFFEMRKVKVLDYQEFSTLQKELIFPVLEERIANGEQIGHFVAHKLFAGDDDEYDALELDVYASFENSYMDNSEGVKLAMSIFPNLKVEKVIERFDKAMSSKGQDILQLVNEAIPGPQSAREGLPKFFEMEYIRVPAGKEADFEKMLNELWLPVAKKLIEAGQLSDWMLFRKIMPKNSPKDYNYIAIYQHHEYKTLFTENLTEHVLSVHPDIDLKAAIVDVSQTREILKTEVYKLEMASTTPPKEGVKYEVVSKGNGELPQKGQEVSFHGKVQDMEGKVLFDSKVMGTPFYYTMGESMFDRFFEKGVSMVGIGGTVQMTSSPYYMDEGMKEITRNKDAVFTAEILSIGKPSKNSFNKVVSALEEDGYEAMVETYKMIEESETSLRESDVNMFAYQLMEKGQMDAAHFLLKMNQKSNPKSWNAWDSLGDSYAARGNMEKAKECYKNALDINPDYTYSKDKLKKLK